MTRRVLTATFVVLMLFLGAELVSLWKQKSALEQQYGEVKAKFDVTKSERDQLQADLLYLGNPVNLGKELRDRLHYQAPGEKVIILVPRASSSTNSTSSN
jgi:hypothetical protein